MAPRASFRAVHAAALQRLHVLQHHVLNALFTGDAAAAIRRAVVPCPLGARGSSLMPCPASCNFSQYMHAHSAIGVSAAVVVVFTTLLALDRGTAPALYPGQFCAAIAELHRLLDQHDESAHAEALDALRIEAQTLERGLYQAKSALLHSVYSRSAALSDEESRAVCIAECTAFVAAAWPSGARRLDLIPKEGVDAPPVPTLAMLEAARELPTGALGPLLRSAAELEAMDPFEIRALALQRPPPRHYSCASGGASNVLSLSQLPSLSSGLWRRNRDSDHADFSEPSGSSCSSTNTRVSYGSAASNSSVGMDPAFAALRLQSRVEAAARAAPIAPIAPTHRRSESLLLTDPLSEGTWSDNRELYPCRRV